MTAPSISCNASFKSFLPLTKLPHHPRPQTHLLHSRIEGACLKSQTPRHHPETNPHENFFLFIWFQLWIDSRIYVSLMLFFLFRTPFRTDSFSVALLFSRAYRVWKGWTLVIGSVLPRWLPTQKVYFLGLVGGLLSQALLCPETAIPSMRNIWRIQCLPLWFFFVPYPSDRKRMRLSCNAH